jgi:NAD(P)-dependent dehydrogenase (short-subunit alcohol dehydrogenase family)
MSDRVIFITGAKGGLGSFITTRFLATGATVVPITIKNDSDCQPGSERLHTCQAKKKDDG